MKDKKTLIQRINIKIIRYLKANYALEMYERKDYVPDLGPDIPIEENSPECHLTLYEKLRIIYGKYLLKYRKDPEETSE